jgi:hypothetical protein
LLPAEKGIYDFSFQLVQLVLGESVRGDMFGPKRWKRAYSSLGKKLIFQTPFASAGNGGNTLAL